MHECESQFKIKLKTTNPKQITSLLYFPHFKLLPESTRLLSLLKVFIIKPTIYNQHGTQLNHNSRSKNIPHMLSKIGKQNTKCIQKTIHLN